MEIVIDKKIAGKTVRTLLRQDLGYSSAMLKKLKFSPGGILVNGKFVTVRCELREGDVLTLAVEDRDEDVSPYIIPVELELPVLYEDDALTVVNKPPDMPSHPSFGHRDDTVANALAWRYRDRTYVFRPVNRLDRDTTGLLILARHGLSAAILSEMVKNRQIHRQYQAVVSGCPKGSGTVIAPIARVDGSTIERCVDFEHGEYACTHYQRLFYNPELDCSLLSLKLETGRTHQIRVHMKHLGHPLYGDFLYNPDYHLINRQSLHSWRLEFKHPLTKKDLVFEAPLPDDMQFVFYGRRSPLG